jgi:hypothetical protein
MDTLTRQDLDSWIFDRWNQADDDLPRVPEVSDLASAQAKRWSAEERKNPSIHCL